MVKEREKEKEEAMLVDYTERGQEQDGLMKQVGRKEGRIEGRQGEVGDWMFFMA